MKLSGLHILLTYQCTFECDHCFVWGSPWQSGTFTLPQITDVLHQAKEAGVEWVYFEGGEPFLYYALMVKGAQLAKELGFHVGVVSNAYWARTIEDALEWLKPLTMLEDLSVSSDLFHYSEMMSKNMKNAVAAAEQLGIPIGVISVCQPEENNATAKHGMIEPGGAQVLFRGRAAQKLVPRADLYPWDTFTECPHEDLREPGRMHLDPLGNLHICQGIVIGNLFETPLKKICAEYDGDAHPVCGPLLNSGPVALTTEYHLAHESSYADACHLCYEMRNSLRERFPNILAPKQMYGV